MANLALVTNDKTNSSATRLQAVLVGGGHTVTMYNSIEAVAATLQTFDVIVSSYCSASATHSAVVKAAFDAGVPVICNGAVSSGTLSVATACRLASSVTLDSGSATSVYCLVADYTFTGTGITPPASSGGLAALGQSYHFTLSTAEAGSVSRIAQRSSTVNDGAILFAAKDTLDLDGNPFPANIAFCNFMFMANYDLTANAKLIVNNLISKLLFTGKVFKGVVQDDLGNKLARTVNLYLRQTGKLVATTTSDGTTGEYTIPAIDDKLHYAVCLDALAGTKSALILDRLVAVDP